MFEWILYHSVWCSCYWSDFMVSITKRYWRRVNLWYSAQVFVTPRDETIRVWLRISLYFDYLPSLNLYFCVVGLMICGKCNIWFNIVQSVLSLVHKCRLLFKESVFISISLSYNKVKEKNNFIEGLQWWWQEEEEEEEQQYIRTMQV